MGNYQGYQKYQDSGVEWLGDIPEHWEVKHLKNVASITRGAILRPVNDPSYFDENGEWLYLNISDVTKCEKFLYTAELKLSDIGSKKSARVLENNLILTASATIGIPIINKVKVCIHDGFIAFKEIKTNLFFLYYVLLNKSIYSAMGKTNTQKNIYLDEVKIVKIGFPPLDEQEKIAQFLDYKTKQIDELIKKKETLIEKLDEKRTAIISHAVTKGLDSSVPIKDSGVEWLGDIPEHWEVIKVKHLTKILRGKFTHRPRNDPRFYDGQHPFIQTGDVANANKFIMEYTQTLNENGYAVSKEFPSGTLVMTIAANIGDMAILNFNACFPDSIVGFLPSKMTDIFFLYHLFSSMKKQFLSTAVLNTQLNLNVERISNIFTVIPPLKEQLQITDFLNKEMQKLDLQKAKIKEAIELLKEYRTSLITNAVTGKIDVSQIAVP
jgi:type I restriction enzyme S subunit